MKPNHRILTVLCMVFVLMGAALIAGCAEETPGEATPTATATTEPAGDLTIATTTSLYDTGVLTEYIAPAFEEKYDVKTKIIYAGTGKALEYGQRGDVDLIMVHDRSREDAFLEDGYGVDRRVFAYNYFVIVGPESDPAGIEGMAPEEAFTTLMDEGQANPDEVKFVSRGDDSGTHGKEKAIWDAAGYDYEEVRSSGPWYIEAGGGMGPTLVMADEKEAYTLSDIGTFLAFKGDLSLVPLVDEGDVLLNIYGAIIINPAKHPDTEVDLAQKWVNFLITPEIQEGIGEFGVEEYGRPLFFPAREAWDEIGVPQAEVQSPIS